MPIVAKQKRKGSCSSDPSSLLASSSDLSHIYLKPRNQLNPDETNSSLFSFFLSFNTYLLQFILHIDLFMHDPRNSQPARKPWYQRAIEMGTLWRSSISTPKLPTDQFPPPNAPTLWKTITRSTNNNIPNSNSSNSNRHKLRKCASLKVATSITRVCLCAPISSYNEVFRAEVPPRRSNSYPRSKPLGTQDQRSITTLSTRLISTSERRVFRGKSLTEDVLMSRFVVEEEAMMQVRRNQMEVIRRKSIMRRKNIGPSRLSRMVMAGEEDNC